MRKDLVLLGISLVLGIILFSSIISAVPTADIQVKEDPWYSARKNNDYGGTNLTGFYAPLPVFFEGWTSSPRWPAAGRASTPAKKCRG